MGSEGFRETTKLSNAQRLELLRLLDRKALLHQNTAQSLRKQDRFEYRAEGVPVTITHPSGGVARFLVSTRNLSCGGVSFIHGGFLHIGTHCRVALRRLDGRETVVLGKVASCRHIAQRIHEVGVSFYEKIDVSEYCDPEAEPVSSAPSATAAAPPVEALVLCIATDRNERGAIEEWLVALGADAETADCLGAGLDLVKKLPFDLVLCDMNLPEAVSGEAIGELRDAGFARPIVGILDPSAASSPRRSACDDAVERPLTRESLDSLIRRVLGDREAASRNAAPLFSTLERDAGAATMLRAYVEECRQSARRLREALESENRDQALSVAKHLQSTGAGYGFAPLVEAAQRAVVTLESSDSLGEAARRIRLLESFCRRVTSDAPRRAA